MTKVRHIPNLSSVAASLETLKSNETKELFGKMGILSEVELEARAHVWAETYTDVRKTEARVFSELVTSRIFPSCANYQKHLAETITKTERVLGKGKGSGSAEIGMLRQVTESISLMLEGNDELKAALEGTEKEEDLWKSIYLCEALLPLMEKLRASVDKLERIVAKEHWPFPTYADIFVY
jgi:glutamine synthetase